MTRADLEAVLPHLGSSTESGLYAWNGWTLAIGGPAAFGTRDPVEGETKPLHEAMHPYVEVTADPLGEVSIDTLRTTVGTRAEFFRRCTKCNGVAPVTCGGCDGSGSVVHQCDEIDCDHTHRADCSDCDGKGNAPECSACSNGVQELPRHERMIDIGEHVFDRLRLAPIAERLEGPSVTVTNVGDAVVLSTATQRGIVMRMQADAYGQTERPRLAVEATRIEAAP